MKGTHEELLEYYQRELTYLREMGVSFARRYPKIANRLELGVDECADPHIERLIEAFAFLAGRVQHNIDSELPIISTSLLGLLYPHFLAPVPSMSIAQFAPDPEQGDLSKGPVIAKDTPLTAFSPTQNTTVRFKTCHPVTLWPLRVEYADFESVDQFDFLDTSNVAGVFRMRLRSTAEPLPKLGFSSLRFYLNGDKVLVNSIYEHFFSQTVGFALLGDEKKKRPTFLPADSLGAAGFEPDENVLPYFSHAHPAYRLLQEYFAFPDKFLFFDIHNLDRRKAEDVLDIVFLFDSLPSRQLTVDENTFKLGCTPVVNLFGLYTDPIRVDHRRSEYWCTPDARNQANTEIHSIESVASMAPGEVKAKPFEPYFSFTHSMEGADHATFWLSRRVPAAGEDMSGTDILLSFVDLDFNPKAPPVQSLFAKVLCTNRHSANDLPAGALLQIEEAIPVHDIHLLKKPTLQRDPPLGGATMWRLISQLSLNHLSLSNDEESLKALREILRLYSGSEEAAALQQVTGIRSMHCRRVTRRIGVEAWRGFCRGMEISLHFDENNYVGSSAYMLGAVLNRFFPLYASINSFTRLVITSEQRMGIWKAWPPAAGEQDVL